MSNLIRFLEQAGQGRYGKGQMQSAINSLEIESAQRVALIEGNAAALNASLGGRSVMRCVVASPD